MSQKTIPNLKPVEQIFAERVPPSTSMAATIWRHFRKHPGAIGGSIVFLLILILVLAAPLSTFNPEESSMAERLQPPSLRHLMGTDALGRDLLTRVLYGGRVSLSVGLFVVGISLSIGVPVGALAGYYGGWLESILMRITDAFLSLPSFLVLILLGAILREVQIPFLERNNVLVIAFVIGILMWMTFARLVRAAFLTIREMDYVTAARCLGGSDYKIITTHIIPNAIGPIIVEVHTRTRLCHHRRVWIEFPGFWHPAANAQLGQPAQQCPGKFHQVSLAGNLPRTDDFFRYYLFQLYRRWFA